MSATKASRKANTHKVLAWEHFQQRDEIVAIAQILEQIPDMSARLQQIPHGAS